MLKQPRWYVFTVRDTRENRRLGLEETIRVVERAGLDMVPLEERGNEMSYCSVEELLERARGTYANGRTKEGIVVRPQTPSIRQLLVGASQ